MNNEFITLTTFRADGLGEIEAALGRVSKTQDLATVSAEKYRKSVDAVGRSLSVVERTFNGPTFRSRVRETDQLVRSQERLTRTLERQASVARLMTGRGIAGAAARFGGFAGSVAGGAAVAGLGMGIAGLSNTVPMARFQAQFDRLQWELGNLLTPYINFATKKTAQAANWLSRQDSGTQTALGGALLGGAGLVAANFASKAAFGMGLGGLGLGAAGAIGTGGRALLAAGGRAALPFVASTMLGYGTGGALGAAGAVGSGLGSAAGAVGAALGSPLSVGAGLAFGGYELGATYRTARRMLARGEGNDTSGLGSIGDVYEKQFAGLTGNARSAAIRAELGSQLKAEQAGIGQYRGTKTKAVSGMADLVMGWMGLSSMGDAGGVNEANEKQTVLRAMLAGKKVKSDHNVNAFVGGSFREIGSSYYEAMGEAGKRAMMKREGEGDLNYGGNSLEQNVADIAAAVKTFQGGDKTGGNKPNYSIPSL